MYKTLKYFITRVFFFFIVFGSLNNTTYANENEDTLSQPQNVQELNSNHANLEEAETSKFNTKDFIFNHIKDSYEWHILTFRSHHVSIPLPVILYSKNSGWNLFMSNKFHHGHESYNGFSIASEGKYEGKIIETNAIGEISLPIDISITKIVASLLFSLILILWMFMTIAKRYKHNSKRVPNRLQSLLEPVIGFVRDDIAKPSIGRKYEKFLPYLLTIFFFIWINNMLGIIPLPPGGTNVTGNIAITLILALFTFVITTVNGNKAYWKEIYDAPGIPWWLKYPPLPIMTIVEIVGFFSKPVTLMIRLFANITAGHIIALAFFSLIFIFSEMSHALGFGAGVFSVLFVVFMTIMEILIAFIQAYVFTLLSAIYIGLATAEHHHE